MKKIWRIIFLFTAVILAGMIFYLINATAATSGLEISVNSTEHTVVMPYEKSFRFIATIKNNGNTTEKVSVQPPEPDAVPKDWHLLSPVGQYELTPGQEINYIAVFEPGEIEFQEGVKCKQGKCFQEEETVTAPFEFSWEGGSQKFDVTVVTKHLSWKDKKDDLSNVNLSVVDKNTNKPISGATISVILASGMEQEEAEEEGQEYEIDIPSGDYLKKLSDEYKIDQTNKGYFLQVSRQSYKSYFESNWLPKEGDSEKTISLEPLEKVGEYELKKTINSGFCIWWIKASDDNKFFAFSQGTHGTPDMQSPDKTKVLLTDADGNTIWENTTGGECWGLDISPNGEYVAAGCHDGNIYVWDKDGNQLWQYKSGENSRVRWVKFSPNSNSLLAGPVENQPEKSGLFDVKSGNLRWSFFTGDWLREGRFSSDSNTVYLASANGTLYALDASSGSLKWLGAGDYYIPFMLGINEENSLAVAAGKGRTFTALNLANSQRKWQTAVDQTITAGGMAKNGSCVGATVGGMGYGVSKDGDFIWTRSYGGVGHNGVFYTKGGDYSLFGGPNPTLFDSKGNVLWQREPDKKIEMTGPVEINTGGAYAVWVSDDGSLLILGGDDGNISFYKGEVKQGKNNYSQLTGPYAEIKAVPDEEEGESPEASLLSRLLRFPIWLILTGVAVLLIIIIVVVIYIIKARRKKSKNV